MIKKLLKLIVLVLILSASLIFASDVITTISPQNPITNNDLSCYANNILCRGIIECNAYWYINKNPNVDSPDFIGPILSQSYTNAGDSVVCKVYISGHEKLPYAIVIIQNSPPQIQNIPDVSFDEDTPYTTTWSLNNYVSDLDNDPITWTYSGNMNINVVISNGRVTLTPVANWNGQETITFTASDGRGGSASDSVVVTVNPINDPISIENIPDVYMDEDTVYELDLSDNIIDVDGDLQDILVFGNINIDVDVDFDNKILTLTPRANWFSEEEIVISVVDSETSDSDSFIVVVRNVNEPPVIDSFNPNQLSVDINEGSSQIFSVFASDADGDALSYSWVLDGVNVGTGTSYMYDALDGPATYTLEAVVSDWEDSVRNSWTVNEINVLPIADAHGDYVCTLNNDIILRGSAVDPGNDVLVYEWDLDNDGLYEGSGQEFLINCDNRFDIGGNGNIIWLRVSDDVGFDIDNTILTVIPGAANNQPYFYPVLEDQVAVVGEEFSYDINAYDADGDVLTYSDNRAEFNINPSSGLIMFTPVSVGIIPVTITVCDDSGFGNACYSESFDIDVRVTANEPPVVQILSPANGASFNVGDSITFGGIGNDEEDGSLTGSDLQWTSSISGSIGQGESFSTSSLAAGTHTITLTGTDSEGATDTDSISITVLVVLTQCSDGIDNDGDGAIDLLDPGCLNAADNDETNPIVMPQCSDGVDNDGDGFIDYPNDLGCVSAGDNNEREAPVAVAGNDISTSVGAIVNFNGLASYDLDGTIVSYSWNFGDGNTGSGASVQHSYSSIGTYNVILTVTDNNGLTGTDGLVASVTSAGAGVSATTSFIKFEHKFEIKELKVISDVEAGEDVRLLVELENTGSYDEKINLRLKNNNLLLIKEFGEYEVEEGKTKLINLVFKLPKDASGKYELKLEAYNDEHQDSKYIELDVSEREGFTSLITGGVAGYDVVIEKESGMWIWIILILIVIVLITLGIYKLKK